MRALKRALLAGVVIVAVAAGWAFTQASKPLDTSGHARQVLVQIPDGARAKSVAEILTSAGVTRNNRAFELAVVIGRTRGKLKAGWYELSAGMSPLHIASKLAHGDMAQAKVTIPEGTSLRRIAQLLDAARICDADKFLAAASPATIGDKYPAIKPSTNTLEGYLFPETYVLAMDSHPQSVVLEMVGQFNDKFLRKYGRVRPPATVPSLHGVVILASLVEREAKWPDERARIAGVLVNRLAKGMPLQCDATVQYALAGHKDRLLFRDLKVQSPYNTYLHKGLPPGPICSPGLPSLKAALRPETNPFLFYVARPDGHHIFSRTYQEHLAAIASLRGKP